MFCTSCGKKLDDSSKFCVYCGTPVAAPQKAAPQQPVYTQPQQPVYTQPPVQGGRPVKSGKKPSKWLFVGVAAVVVLAIALAAFLVLSGSPAGQVASAFAATGKEYAAVAEVLSLDDMAKLAEKETFSLDMDLQIQEFEEDPAMAGFGISLQQDVNLDKRKIAFAAIPYYGAVELMDVELVLDDEMVYFALPQFLPDPYYGISTVTAMADLEAMGADVNSLGDLGQLSFNLFDLIETVRTESKAQNEAVAAELEKATNILLEAVTVEKVGKETLDINGTETNCTHYVAAIPVAELEDWVVTFADVFNGMDYTALMETLCEQMNLPETLVQELLSQIYVEEMDVEDILYVLEELGDMALDIYVSDGKIASLQMVLEAQGSTVAMELFLGGGEHYADDLTLKLIADGSVAFVTSTGDHTGASGTFRDVTCFVNPYGEVIEVSTEYVLKNGEFEVSIKEDGMEALYMEGTVKADADSMELNIRDLSLWDTWYETKVIGLQVGTTITAYSERIKVQDAVLFADMTQDDVLAVIADAESNASVWIMDILEKAPELMDILY